MTTYEETVSMGFLTFHVEVGEGDTTLGPRMIVQGIDIEGHNGRVPIMYLLSGYAKKVLGEKAMAQHKEAHHDSE